MNNDSPGPAMPPNTLYLPELREMLAENDTAGLQEFCRTLHPARTSEFMDGLSSSESWQVLQHADLILKIEIFGFFAEEKQVAILESIDRAEAAKLIGDLPPDDRVDLLPEMKPRIVDEIMPLLPVNERRDIQRLSAHAEDTAGAEMTSEFARLSEELTVAQAFEEIARQAEDLETIYYLYVVDQGDHLLGLLSARELVSHMGRPNTKIGQLMNRDIVSVHVQNDQEDVAKKVARFNLLAIPVVDDEHRMVGIITHDDVLDVMVEEATEDAYRAAAVEPLDETYLETSLLNLTWKRGIWLTVLFFFALVTAVVLSQYEPFLKKYTWLMAFVPLVISTGGNSGNQSAALVITSLSTGTISLRDWWLVVRRELAMGLLLGGILGGFGYLSAIYWAPSSFVALIIPITLILVVLCGTLSGSLLPLTFRRMGLDPALMSNPFVAGLIDVIGILIYVKVAVWILGLAG